MPPKAKHKNANQHDKRHESGLAAPGKRITKQRSNTNLQQKQHQQQQQSNGLNGHVPAVVVTSNSNSNSIPSNSHPGLNDHDAEDSPVDLPDDDMVTSSSSAAAATNTPPVAAAAMSSTVTSESSRRVSDAPAYTTTSVNAKHVGRSASSTFALAMTILSACPLSDAIAILILLLSLPPTLIITIHTLFASLTFVPPSAGVSLSSWNGIPSLGDWFHATAAGGPSLFTILTADAVMTLLYLCSPLFTQNIFLDLGQAVIAISLSGATAAKGGSANSVAACSIIVFLSHFLRYNKLHLTGLEYLRTLLHNLGTGIALNVPQSSTFSTSSSVIYGWPRTLLGCHILAQGLLTLIRRTLAGYANHTRASASKKQDPEAASYGDGSKSTASPVDSGHEPVGGTGSDGRPPGPPPTLREASQRLSNVKKKKKQANQVRSRQPLWAAIASTKVTFLKEMEQKQASNDQLEAAAAAAAAAASSSQHNSTDTTANQAVPFLATDDRICITDMRPTDVLFRANLPSFSHASSRPKPEVNTTTSVSAGIDKTKPFFVRLNGADWSSTKISEEEEGAAWHGEVFGLTPLTNYTCELISISTQQVLCTTSLITPPGPSTEQTSIVAAAPQPQSLRPLSPISTLKQSIAAAEMKREEARNKLKRARRDHKNAASAVRKEIDQLNAKVASSGGQDERQRQRILQLTQHLRQANEATVSLKEETEALGEIPEAELREYNDKKRAWQAACDRKNSAMADFDSAKAQVQRDIAQVTSELSSTGQKRDRLSTRKGKLTEQLDRLTSQKNADVSARQRHEQQRAGRIAEYQRQEAQLGYWTQQTNKDAEEHAARAHEAFAQMEYINTVILQQHQSLSGPPTPEGDLPGTNGILNRPPAAFDFTMFGGFGQGMRQQQQQHHHHHHQQQQQPQMFGGVGQSRGRSSSMLSGYSGFTDEDLDVVPGAIEGNNTSEMYPFENGNSNGKGKGRVGGSPVGGK